MLIEVHNNKPLSRGKPGFALISVISLIVLLALVAVALLTLAKVTLRTASVSEDEAKENAKMALHEAIGKLQLYSGSDTRITAPANAVAGAPATAPRHLTGVWRSWEGLNHDTTTGKPTKPEYTDKTRTGDPLNDDNNGRFLGWLTSNDSGDTATAPPSITGGNILLLGDGTLGAGAEAAGTDIVSIDPSPIENAAGTQTGSYAWWIQGNNSKMLVKPSETSSSALRSTQLVASSGPPSLTDIEVTDDEDLEKVFTYSLLNLHMEDSDFSDDIYHDVTTYSKGLLTNVSCGGWKRDLSLASENWNGISDFTPMSLSPGSELTVTKSADPGDFIYSWAPDYSSTSWSALMDYTAFYKRVSEEGGKYSTVANTNAEGDDPNQVYVSPLLNKISCVYSYYADQASGGRFKPMIVINPSVSFWNPYNITLNVEDVLSGPFWFYDEAFLHNFKFKLTDPTLPAGDPNIWENSASFSATAMINRNSKQTRGLSRGNFPNLFPASETTMFPGESRFLSPEDSNTDYSETGVFLLSYGPGYDLEAGVRSALEDFMDESKSEDTEQVPHQNSGTIFQAIATTTTAYKSGKFWTSGGRNLFANMLESEYEEYQAQFETEMELEGLVEDDGAPAGIQIQEADGEAIPFYYSEMKLRTPADSHFSVKSFSSNPICHQGGSGDIDTTGENRMESAMQTPYEYYGTYIRDVSEIKFEVVEDLSFGENDFGGYMGMSGSYAGGGSGKLSLMELPIRPLVSIGELQHFNINQNNIIPPQVFNPIGNSNVTAELGLNSIQSSMTCDHSYISNHLLFDDWFVSSLVDDPVSNMSVDTMVDGLLDGEATLPNRLYVAASQTAIKKTNFTDNNAWKNVASELEVDGMFNVNSTSAKAWAGLLKSVGRNYIPYVKVGAGGNWELEQNNPVADQYAFPRLTVTGDISETSPSAEKLTSYITLSDTQIDDLADEIVVQIQARGPFLSLSEFINRRISDNASLAEAGAIESALLALSNNLHADLAGISEEALLYDTSGPEFNGLFDYEKALEGETAYGMPGWIRQADILKPIVPVLSARDDTFTIRAYGESNNGQQAWCEAIVQRTADYVDNTDEKTKFVDLSGINQQLGRKYKIISFRWLDPNEI